MRKAKQADRIILEGGKEMKRQNAFALRGYKGEKILQRPFFKSLKLPAAMDAEILSALKIADSDSVDDMEAKLHTIKATHNRIEEYRGLIERHTRRCDKYNKTLGVKGEKKRTAVITDYFTATLDCVELAEKFAKLYFETERKIQERYRREFSARLRQARIAAGLTQRQLGELVQVSPLGISRYERDERDIPIYTVIRLAKVLNLSGDQILGLK